MKHWRLLEAAIVKVPDFIMIGFVMAAPKKSLSLFKEVLGSEVALALLPNVRIPLLIVIGPPNSTGTKPNKVLLCKVDCIPSSPVPDFVNPTIPYNNAFPFRP